MPSQISRIETLARQTPLIEATAKFWSSQELTDIIVAGIKDLWRDIVDLKQDFYLTKDTTNVFLDINSTQLSGVPADVHKVYLIEPRDVSGISTTTGLQFMPAEYNTSDFRTARARDPITPVSDTIYYCITGQGAPVGAPVILTAPQVNSVVLLNFVYVPVLPALTSTSNIPIPGEADNALLAWTVAWARAKERENRSPDPEWLAIYSTEKTHLLQSLGLRQFQEPKYVDAIWAQYW